MHTDKNLDALVAVKAILGQLSDEKKAANLARFFQVHSGGYGEGDSFIGVTVPDQRAVAKKYYASLSDTAVESLLQESIHEYRLTALFILVLKYEKARSDEAKENLFGIYCRNAEHINNWDLVDSSAPQIVGGHLFSRDRSLLYRLAASGDIWKQRIAILATFFFIKKLQFDDTLKIATLLLNHDHHLIHKAVGWMLREIGNRDFAVERNFIKEHYTQMPRTMLRYAIEKFEAPLRQDILQGKF
jgi:3-methyladenine DNA glycosylase AlkD